MKKLIAILAIILLAIAAVDHKAKTDVIQVCSDAKVKHYGHFRYMSSLSGNEAWYGCEVRDDGEVEFYRHKYIDTMF